MYPHETAVYCKSCLFVLVGERFCFSSSYFIFVFLLLISFHFISSSSAADVQAAGVCELFPCKCNE